MGFQALMPGTTTVEQESRKAPGGEMEVHRFTVVPKGNQEMFVISTCRFAVDMSEDGDTRKLLEFGRDDVVSGGKGEVRSERQIVLGGNRGVELELAPPQGRLIKARVYATPRQIYHVLVYSSPSRLSSPDVRKFFDSFKILGER